MRLEDERGEDYAVKFTARDSRNRAGREYAARQTLEEAGLETAPRARFGLTPAHTTIKLEKATIFSYYFFGRGGGGGSGGSPSFWASKSRTLGRLSRIKTGLPESCTG